MADLPRFDTDSIAVRRAPPEKSRTHWDTVMEELKLFNPMLLVENIQQHRESMANREKWMSRQGQQHSRERQAFFDVLLREIRRQDSL